ncbi:MAG: hypothetical protein WHS89_05730 [Acidimicrobiales bacterium]
MSRATQVDPRAICDVWSVQTSTGLSNGKAPVRGPRGLWRALATALVGPDPVRAEPEETAHLAYLARIPAAPPKLALHCSGRAGRAR